MIETTPNRWDPKSHTQNPCRHKVHIETWFVSQEVFAGGIPTGKNVQRLHTNVDSEPPNGSMMISINLMKAINLLMALCSSGPLSSLTNGVADKQSGPLVKEKSVLPGLKLTPGYISSGLVQNLVSSTPYVPPSKKDYEILFQPLFDEYFNPPPRAVSLDPVAVAAQELLIQSVQLRQLPLIKMYHLLVLHQQIRKFNLKSFFKVLKK
ncbi:hypothetical protein Tco_0266498 [Tanacetum coccineum]